MNQFDAAAEWAQIRSRKVEALALLNESQWRELEEWELRAARPAVALRVKRTGKRSLGAALLGRQTPPRLGPEQSRFGGPSPFTPTSEGHDFFCRLRLADIAPQIPGLPPDCVLDVELLHRRSIKEQPLVATLRTEEECSAASLQFQATQSQHMDGSAKFRFPECSVSFEVRPIVDWPDEHPRDAAHADCPIPTWLSAANREVQSAVVDRLDTIESQLGTDCHTLLPGWSTPLLETVGASEADQWVPILRIQDDHILGTSLGTNTLYLLADRQALIEGRLEGFRSFSANA